jgi:phosphatidate cytidylyltransferase
MSRVLPGLAMAGAWVALILYGGSMLFWLISLILALILLHEYFRMTGSFLPPGNTQYLLIALGLAPMLGSLTGVCAGVNGGLMAGLVGTVVLTLHRYGELDDPLGLLVTAGFALLYIPFTMAHLVLLYGLSQGPSWLLVLTAVTAGSDTGAYYSGRTFGRRKLCPTISPNKTVAGAVGGVVAGIAASSGMAWLIGLETSWLLLMVVTAVLVVLGIVGDLIESVLKRSVGVKDSGTLLGGHGGLLDRMDSLLLTGPVLYYLILAGLL